MLGSTSITRPSDLHALYQAAANQVTTTNVQPPSIKSPFPKDIKAALAHERLPPSTASPQTSRASQNSARYPCLCVLRDWSKSEKALLGAQHRAADQACSDLGSDYATKQVKTFQSIDDAWPCCARLLSSCYFRKHG